MIEWCVLAKNIWIINQYASTPDVGMGGRHYYIAKELANLGNKVSLIASSFTHLLRKSVDVSGEFRVDESHGFKMVWVKTPDYAGAHNKKRIFNWFYFCGKLIKLPVSVLGKPDVIIYSSPSLVGYLGAERLARKYQAKLIFEVRDIWPLTLCEVGGYSHRHPFIRFLQYIEDRAYRKSDVVASNLQLADEHIKGRGGSAPFLWVPNGFSLDEVQGAEPLSDQSASLIPRNKFVVGYTGSVGLANSLDTVLDAAALLSDRDDIFFAIVGEGGDKDRLLSIARSRDLKNVAFLPSLPKRQVQSMISMFDACYIGWKDVGLYRYGIAANKIPEYLWSGKPILHSYSGAADPVELFGCGISVPAEDPSALADAILNLSSQSVIERSKMGERGRAAALANYEYGSISKRYSEVFE